MAISETSADNICFGQRRLRFIKLLLIAMLAAVTVSGCSYTFDKGDDSTENTYDAEVENTDSGETEETAEEQLISIKSKDPDEGEEAVLPTERKKIKHVEVRNVDTRTGMEGEFTSSADYDEFGNITLLIHSYNGEETYRQSFEIVDGKTVSSITTPANEEPYVSEYIYDDNGDLIRTEATYSTDTGSETHITEYAKFGENTRVISDTFFVDDQMTAQTNFAYDENGDITEQSSGGGNLIDHIKKYEYSKYFYFNGSIARRQYISDQQNIKSLSQTIYNENMDPVSETEYAVTYKRDITDCIVHEDKKYIPCSETTYTYEYYD